MDTRVLGQGLGCGAIGLGCMSMSGQYGAFDDAESRATLRRAVELGVTLFDTADVYGPFANEALVGRELAPFREQVVVATKFGLVRASTGQHLGVNGRPDYVKFSCDLSLQRLGLEVIDIYFQHRIDPDVPIEETVGAMSELVKAGKVRHIGLCEVGAATIRRAHNVHPLAAVQSEYSLWARDIEYEVLPTLRELGIGLVAYSPLGRGFLTGAIASRDELGADDYRRKDPRFQATAFAHNLQLANKVKQFATGLGRSPGQVALAWVLAQAASIIPIPGTKRRKYLEDNLQAASVQLSPEQCESLSRAAAVEAVQGDRYADMSNIGR